MRLQILLSAVLIGTLLAEPYASVAQDAAPWLGAWRLTSDSPRYKRVTLRIQPWEDGLKVSYDMVGIRGGLTHWEWTGKLDGKDYPMQGVDNVLTNAYRKIDDHTNEIVVKVDGVLVATSRVVSAPDGKTLSVATEERTADGTMIRTTSVYERL